MGAARLQRTSLCRRQYGPSGLLYHVRQSCPVRRRYHAQPGGCACAHLRRVSDRVTSSFYASSTRTRCLTLKIMPRTDGLSGCSMVAFSLSRPNALTVSFWLVGQPIVLLTRVTRSFFSVCAFL